MTKEQLNQAATIIYGDGWKARLAKDLDVNERTIGRWASGETELPDWLPFELLNIYNGKRDELQNTLFCKAVKPIPGNDQVVKNGHVQ